MRLVLEVFFPESSTQMSSLSFLALNVLFADETSLHPLFAISRAGMLVLGVLVY